MTDAVRFDNRIYLVDADQFHRVDFEDTETIIDDAAATDLIVLNKQDLASDAELERISALLNQSAPNSSLVQTSEGKCATELMLGQVQADLGKLAKDATSSPLSKHHDPPASPPSWQVAPLPSGPARMASWCSCARPVPEPEGPVGRICEPGTAFSA
ncbi:GTP-binding protein [Nitratireductor sp. XY-223]|uniref:GTP-binding protein n=1 Tax=Nitratireductor sp. XY-223 TaxID=2561926 RepID=UPI00145B78FB|nr:GTP-binding protein [Nitratireductor sp. XY-223]